MKVIGEFIEPHRAMGEANINAARRHQIRYDIEWLPDRTLIGSVKIKWRERRGRVKQQARTKEHRHRAESGKMAELRFR